MGDRLKIDPAYRQRLSEVGLDGVEKVLSMGAWAAPIEGKPVYAQIQVNGQPSHPALYVKRFRYPTWRMRLNFLGRCLFGKSRAKREFLRLRRMHRLGIQSSRPLALGERRRFGFLTDCFLVTEGVPASDSLRDFAVQYFHKSASGRGRELKRAMMDQLVEHIRLMHSKRYFHGELTWDNILIRQRPDGSFEFYFTNALRGRRVFWPWRQRRLRGRDLAGIDAVPDEFLSRADKIRFIKRYLDRDELSAKDRAWMKQIQQINAHLFAPRSTYTTARPADPPTSSPRQVHSGVHP